MVNPIWTFYTNANFFLGSALKYGGVGTIIYGLVEQNPVAIFGGVALAYSGSAVQRDGHDLQRRLWEQDDRKDLEERIAGK